MIVVDHSGFYMPFNDYDDCNFVPNTLVQHRATGQCLLKLLRMLNLKSLFHYRNIGSYF